MRNYLPLALTCILIGTGSVDVRAQSETRAQDGVALQQVGAWSLLFQVSDNFTLRSFDGTAFSVRKQISQESAVRFGMEFTMRKIDHEQVGEVSQDILSAQVHLLRTPGAEKRSRVFPYFGAGPFVRYTRDGLESPNTQITTWGAGVQGVLGVEWFARDEISFLAEYRSAVSARFREIERNGSSDKQTEYEVVSEGVRFGVSVYF